MQKFQFYLLVQHSKHSILLSALKYIYNNLKKKFKEIEVYNLLFLQEKGYKLSIFDKLKINFSGLKPLYLWEKKELQKQEKAKKQNRRRKIAKWTCQGKSAYFMPNGR